MGDSDLIGWLVGWWVTHFVDAKWFTRGEVKEMLAFTQYREKQQTSLSQLHQACHPNESKSDSVDPGVSPTDIPSVPGPYAIAHHLLATWVRVGSSGLGGGKPWGLGPVEHLKSSI